MQLSNLPFGTPSDAMGSTPSVMVNGKLLNWEDARVHVASHALHYGTSIFEGIKGYPSFDANSFAIVHLRRHVERFFRSAEILGIPLPEYTPDRLEREIVETVNANLKAGSALTYIRPLAFRMYDVDTGAGRLGVSAKDCPVMVCVLCLNWAPYFGFEARERGVPYTVSPYTIGYNPPDTLPAKSWKAKSTLRYSTYGQMTQLDAKSKGVVDGVIEYWWHLGSPGISAPLIKFVGEGAGMNLAAIDDRSGTLYTPPLEAPILAGITRECVIELCGEMGVRVEEVHLTLEEFLRKGSAIAFGSATEIVSITTVDGAPVGCGKPGRIARDLQQQYLDIVEGRTDQHREWCTVLTF